MAVSLCGVGSSTFLGKGRTDACFNSSLIIATSAASRASAISSMQVSSMSRIARRALAAPEWRAIRKSDSSFPEHSIKNFRIRMRFSSGVSLDIHHRGRGQRAIYRKRSINGNRVFALCEL